MIVLVVLLVLFLLIGLAQLLLAGRIVDRIHGGSERRAARGRALDVLVLRAAGAFVAALALIALTVAVLAGGLG